MDESDPLARATQRRTLIGGTTLGDEDFRERRDRDLAEWRIPAARAVVASVICLVVAALLASDKLVEIAERREFGDTRDVMLRTAEGIDRVANLLSLNRPYDAILSLRGLDDAPARTVSIESLITVPAEPSAPPSAPPSVPPSVPATTVTTPVVTTTEPVVTTTPPGRVPRRDAPLRTLVIGDSQAEFVGQSLTNVSADRGGVVDVRLEFEISTGLARPDYFNWPAREQELIDEWDPEAIVVFFGANDDQDMQRADQYFPLGSEQWADEYRLRVELMMDIAANAEAVTYWILQPPLRGDNDTVDQINAIARRAAEGRDDVVIVDAHTLFSDGDGGYSVFLETDRGDTEQVRNDDGVHLTRDGSDWLARVLYDTLGTRSDLAG